MNYFLLHDKVSNIGYLKNRFLLHVTSIAVLFFAKYKRPFLMSGCIVQNYDDRIDIQEVKVNF